MNAVEIEQAISELSELKFDPTEFPFQFLTAFGNKETTIDRLRSGSNNRSEIPNGVLQKNNIHIATCNVGEVNKTIGKLRTSPETLKAKAKFILATDGIELHAEDLNSGEIIASEYNKLANHFGFFLPLAGITTVKQIRDNPIDIQATSRLNRLYLELLRNNEDWATQERRHEMNQFMGRLIFCFFAEDTNIFNGNNLFTKTIEQMSDNKSDNTDFILSKLFLAMDTPFNNRSSLDIPRWADAMPYVNGALFAGSREVPKFSRAARSYLLHAGSLNWKEINPDIFGSMIQAVADEEERGGLGMHYTSVPNILKVLNPLFLDELRDTLYEAGHNSRKLLNLKKRLTRIRVFDPACGSGNFLVIAYKEIREIEFKINQLRQESQLRSEIPLNNFRGIEIREFPAEIARLSLIIAEFQCDVLYRGQREALNDFLPLDSKNWIVCGNALRLDWLSICPPTGVSVKHLADDLFYKPIKQYEIDFENEGGETFICGNPPFAGQKKKSESQRDDMSFVMSKYFKTFGELDYVSAFYVKAAEACNFIGAAVAFVATNSLVQGRQVPLLWPMIEKTGAKIIFGYRSFLWKNNASKNASVYVVIIGISKFWTKEKYIFDQGLKLVASNITGYLTVGKSIKILKSKVPVSHDLEVMRSGNMPLDNGNLILESQEAANILKEEKKSKKFVKRLLGAKEINQGLLRYCLWIKDSEIEEAKSINFIDNRLRQCREFRKNSTAPQLAQIPHSFRDRHTAKKWSIIIPNLSSEKRKYRIPLLVKNDTIITNLALAIYDGSLFQYGIIASRLHHLWVEAVCGKLKQDFRYSNDLGWHTFPLPKLTKKQKEDLKLTSLNIILAIEDHFPITLNDLYNTNNMPENLRLAHESNDEILERIYIGRRFKNDTERLEVLFNLYSKIISTPISHERVS